MHEDVRAADFGTGYALAMLISGEFNVFRTDDAPRILRKAFGALRPGGVLLLEPHTVAAVRAMGQTLPVWYAVPHGLFSDAPHLCLKEARWDEDAGVATECYFIVDAASGEVSRHALSSQSYTDEGYGSLLAESGFEEVSLHPSLTGSAAEAEEGLIAITARRRSS